MNSFCCFSTYNICFTGCLSVTWWRWCILNLFSVRFDWRSKNSNIKSRKLNYSKSYSISMSCVSETTCGFNGFIIAPKRIHDNIIPAKISMPIFQPNLLIKISANGPNESAPMPVPAVTKPKIDYAYV